MGHVRSGLQMRIVELDAQNRRAIEMVPTFLEAITPERAGVIDQNFHYHKNHFPYFGYIEAETGGKRFLMFSANDDLVAMTFFWFGPDMFEPMSLRLWQERVPASETILDVGAFSGVYSLCAAHNNPGCHIYAVEAARRTYGRLLVNVQSNGLSKRITCINKAISADRGTERFLRYRGENILGVGDGFVRKSIDPQASEETVETIGLDQLCEERSIRPDLIKIDIEGAEALALAGMRELLRVTRPILLIEVIPSTAADVHRCLRDARYTIWNVNERAMRLEPCEGTVSGKTNLLAEPI